ncbi:MAG: hypothetical protein Kow0077_25900 [Anaerolineae bacterium]
MARVAVVVIGALGSLLAALWIFGERGALLRPSTRAFLQAVGGWRQLFTLRFWEGYAYMRWSNQYITWGRRWLFPRVKDAGPENPLWATVYHGKVVPTGEAQKLISINQPIPHQTLEQIIPYDTAREIVLQGPPDVAVYDCPCRAGVEHPCEPTQVCMVVGQPFVDFILEHNPQSSRRLSTQEAVELLQAEHERGHIHAVYFKDVMLDRFYAICNCCSCCCGGIQAMKERGVPMVIPSGYVAEVDEMACIGCGECAEMCPFDAITVTDAAEIDWQTCMGCGVCEGQCAVGAISLTRDARKGTPLEVDALLGRS